MTVESRICRIAAPIFAAFAAQPWNCAENPSVLTNSWSTAFSQTSALELCLYFARHILRKKSLFQLLVELIESLFAFHHDEFLEIVFRENQLWKIDYQKRFPATQVHSMNHMAGVCRGSAWRKNLVSLVDWERETYLRISEKFFLRGQLILLVVELVLGEIQHLCVVRFERKLVAEVL